MNHPIAQFVALTCHANAFLQGRNVPPFFPGNSTCTFCDWVQFVYLSKTVLGKIREERVAGNPDAWFSYLKAAGVSAVHLSRTPRNDPRISDRMSAAFVDGAGTWAMEAWALAFGPLTRWGVEGANGVGRHTAMYLVGQGHDVRDVCPMRTAEEGRRRRQATALTRCASPARHRPTRQCRRRSSGPPVTPVPTRRMS